MFEFFKTKTKQPELPTGDTAWSDVSRLYSSSHFERYNPDSLIGRKGYGIYKKMMQDEQIKACVKFKRDAITSRDYQFVLDPDEYGLTPEEAERRIKLSYKTIDKMRGSWMDAQNYILSAMYNGFSMTEKVYTQIEFNGKTWWGLDALRVKPFDTFYFTVDLFGNLEKITQRSGGSTQEIDPNKFIHYVVNPDHDQYYGSSDLRECYRAWFSKDMIIKFRNMWLERHAGGFRWLQADEKNNIRPGSADWTKLQDVLSNVQTTTSAIIPAGFEMKTDYPANVAGFKEAIDDNDSAIARALLVPALLGISPQGATGSFAQSVTQMEAFLWTLDADTSRLEDTLNEQLFRPLGEINFGDDAWPRYKFKPASMQKKLEIIKAWGDMVQKGAVTQSDTDEAHIREMIEMPAKQVSEESASPEVVLNGAQISSIVDVATKVGLGQISVEAGIAILTAAFPLTLEQATSMLIQVPKPEAQQVEGQSAASGVPDKQPAAEIKPDEIKPVETAPAEKKPETVMGKGIIKASAFSAAMTRVDFAVISKSAEAAIEDNTAKVAGVMDSMVKDLIVRGKSAGTVQSNVLDNITALKPDPKITTKLNKVLYAALVEGQLIGIRHAENEIDKAKKQAFSRVVNRERITLIADDFFRTSAFKITGNLTDEAVKLIENEILNGSKYDYTWDQIEENIYAVFAKKGMISTEQAREALGDALNIEVPDARLRTIVRTGTFDAINNARYSYFTDPDLGDFVIGFEYSAILDDRVTEYCRHMDGDDAGNHSVAWWDEHRDMAPPAHYNCRSLLVPVTQIDAATWEEGPEPTVDPPGF